MAGYGAFHVRPLLHRNSNISPRVFINNIIWSRVCVVYRFWLLVTRKSIFFNYCACWPVQYSLLLLTQNFIVIKLPKLHSVSLLLRNNCQHLPDPPECCYFKVATTDVFTMGNIFSWDKSFSLEKLLDIIVSKGVSNDVSRSVSTAVLWVY